MPSFLPLTLCCSGYAPFGHEPARRYRSEAPMPATRRSSAPSPGRPRNRSARRVCCPPERRAGRQRRGRSCRRQRRSWRSPSARRRSAPSANPPWLGRRTRGRVPEAMPSDRPPTRRCQSKVSASCFSSDGISRPCCNTVLHRVAPFCLNPVANSRRCRGHVGESGSNGAPCLHVQRIQQWLLAMNRRLRLVPPKHRLAQRSGGRMWPIGLPAGLNTITPSRSAALAVGAPLLPQPHHRLLLRRSACRPARQRRRRVRLVGELAVGADVGHTLRLG